MTNIPGNQPPQGYPSQPTTPPTPPYQPLAYPSPKKGPSAVKIILIIVGIFAVLGLIGAGVLSYFAYKVAQTSISSQPVTESDLGVTIYPGAEQGKANLRMTVAGKDMLTANFLTSDSKDQVIAFYQSKLGPGAQTRTFGDRETLFLKTGSGESVSVTVRPNRFNGKTEIVIAHAKNAAAQGSN
jgi:hypothetical protein